MIESDRQASERGTDSMTRSPLEGWTLRRALSTMMVLGGVFVVGLGAPHSSSAAVGEHFSFAPLSTEAPDPETDAPAFPHVGDDPRAFWAGVCDLRAGGPAVGSSPITPFPGCIEHPAATSVLLPGQLAATTEQMTPPLAPGVTPGTSGINGWKKWDSNTPGPGPGWRLQDVTQAGSRPDGSASFWFSRSADNPLGITTPAPTPDGSPRNIRVSLPPGVVGNPNAIPKCPSAALDTVPTSCPPKTQVGVATLSLSFYTAVFPVYNVQPRKGKTAEFIVSGAGVSSTLTANVPVVGAARTDGDFGVDAAASSIPGGLAVVSQTFTLWGVPWAASHDVYRPVAGYCGATAGDGTNAWQTPGIRVTGLPGGSGNGCSQAGVHYDPSWGPIKPFLSTQTECSPVNPVTSIVADNWHTDVQASADSGAPQITDCGDLAFNAALDFTQTSTLADGPSGLQAKLTIPQNNDPPAAVRFNPDDATGAPAHWKSPEGRATAHLDKTVATLPEGVAVNPSSATGLVGCTEQQIGLAQLGNPPRFNNEDPFDGQGQECPDGSIIGTVDVQSPLLDEHLTGQVVLGTPRPEDIAGSDQALRLRVFIVVRNAERGLVAKIYGATVTDPVTGQLKATFDKNPQLPFDTLDLKLKGGDRGVLALPQRCGSKGWSVELTPWSAAHGAGGVPTESSGSFTAETRCALGFAPKLRAGVDTRTGGHRGGTLTFKFTREDGEQWFGSILQAKLPTGLLATVRGVPLCSNAAANAGNCSTGSRIGSVDACAGSGSPYCLEKKGDVYLTEGYKGGEYGLAVVVPVEVGPFKGDVALKTIIVRQAIHVDRSTAQVTAVSDPFPRVWHGVPLRVREVTVTVDRSGFIVNPTDCSAKQFLAEFESTEGARATVTWPFQVADCATLPFKPKLALSLTGRKQVTTGKHPGVKAVVTQPANQAGISRAVVRLPKSIALDPNNAQALCEFEDGTKPDLENRCPKGSIVGRARAVTSLLNDPLVGNVYFVKNIRRDPKTGNAIRTLPMIIVALRGEIAINLRGESSTTKGGKLVNTFASVPDAPVDRFNLNINGGSNGILAVTRTRKAKINICRGQHVAEVDMDGQNGKRNDSDVRVKTPRCAAKRAKAACRTAKQRRSKVCRGRAKKAKRALARTANAVARGATTVRSS